MHAWAYIVPAGTDWLALMVVWALTGDPVSRPDWVGKPHALIRVGRRCAPQGGSKRLGGREGHGENGGSG